MTIAGYFGRGPLDLGVEAGDLSRGITAGVRGFEWTIAGGRGEGAAVIR